MKPRPLALAVLLLAAPLLAAAAPGPLALKPLGHRYYSKTGADVPLYCITVGDTSAEDRKLEHRPDQLMPFKLDAAQYGAVGDGFWRLARFRMPDLGPRGDAEAFLAFLRRKDVQALLNSDIYADADFGEPGDYIYKRRRLPASELPAPFDRLSAEALAPVATIFRYNADGTMSVLLKGPDDEEGRAQRVLERIQAELARSAP